jgi:Copper transport outer membrane protein, MctB
VFDFRYHVASLAAVFIALVLGIVVGVGLSGSGITKEADLKLAREQRDVARAQRDAARARLQQISKTADAFSVAYPALLHDRLRDKSVAILFIGPTDDGLAQAIDKTLSDAGARPATRVLSVNVPVDVEAIDATLAAKGPQFQQYVGDDKLQALGGALGGEFVSGGETPLWKALGRQLVGERVGNVLQPADGVVVARTVRPQEGTTATFLRGLYHGLVSAGVPAVGVETTAATPSAVTTFRDRGLSSVDDIDLDTGRAALALLLAGADAGQYGVKPGADEIVPPAPA